MALAATRRKVLGEEFRDVVVKAVGGDRGRVDEALRLGRDSSLEDVARPCEVDLPALASSGHDDERQVDDDIGAGYQGIDRVAVENVALAVLDLPPALRGGSNGLRAMPRMRLTRSLRSRAATNGPPTSPVGPVTATVRAGSGMPEP